MTNIHLVNNTTMNTRTHLDTLHPTYNLMALIPTTQAPSTETNINTSNSSELSKHIKTKAPTAPKVRSKAKTAKVDTAPTDKASKVTKVAPPKTFRFE
ncbi:hypothetical protein BGZ94_006492, partial [Podila epigama]